MGCVRDNSASVRFRILSIGITRVLDLLRKSLLGNRAIDSSGHSLRSVGSYWPVELPYRLCTAVGLADSTVRRILWGPESPWYLIRTDRIDDAYKALAKLDNKGEEPHRQTVTQIMHTLKIENQMESGSSYLDCFRGADLRRTEIVCMTFAGQVPSGSMFAYGPTYFFQQAGIPTGSSYGITVGGTGKHSHQ